MTTWIIIGGGYALALLAFNRLGGLNAAAAGIREWGYAVSDVYRRPERDV